MRLSDRVLVMLNGSVVDEGTHMNYIKIQKHPFAARLIRSNNGF